MATMLLATLLSLSSASADASSCTMHRWNSSGCTTAGNYVELSSLHSADECCAACAANETGCSAWTFHASPTSPICCLSANPKRGTHPVNNATCGCRTEDCAPPAVACDPIYRPPRSEPTPRPAGITRSPNFVTVIVDDLGWDDTAIVNPSLAALTPTLAAMKSESIVLTRHHTYVWCSPTRRSFLSGRYPVHISGIQAPTQSNYLPLQFTTLGEKLAAATPPYESHFVGKGHLGYRTVDHLPFNRGFTSHLGYLGGGESYDHGCAYGGTGIFCKHRDMWHNAAPEDNASCVADLYSTNFYTRYSIDKIEARNKSRPFWLHLPYQAVHGPYTSPLPWETVNASTVIPGETFRSGIYASMLRVMDTGIGNITAALKAQTESSVVDDSGKTTTTSTWDNTLFILFGDNGGDCGLPSQANGPGGKPVKGQPGMASNYPLLGRKCTAYDGGTRVAAIVSGGLIPPARRGTVSNQLMYVTDWFPTLSKLAGVDPADDWRDASGIVRGIDGVDLWPTLRDGDAVATSWIEREFLPTSERSLIYWPLADRNTGKPKMWKIITSGNSWLQTGAPYGKGEFKANRFHANGSQYMDTFNPCLPTTTTGAITSSSSTTAGRNLEGGLTIIPGALTVPPSCITCTNSTPCVFEVLSDPNETKNLLHSDTLPVGLVTKMLAKLASFAVYSPMLMTSAQKACYNCSAHPTGYWLEDRYVGPQCDRLGDDARVLAGAGPLKSEGKRLASPPAICDILASHATPCVAAHSMTRSLFMDYDGSLYSVTNVETKQTKDIHVRSRGGTADIASQRAFCGDARCVVNRIYDQSPSGNHLGIEHGFAYLKPPRNSTDAGVNITSAARVLLAGGAEAYGALFDQHCDVHVGNCDGLFAGYSNRTTRNVPTGVEPQTVCVAYALLGTWEKSSGCCFDYGNAEVKGGAMLEGSMEAVYFGCGDKAPPLLPCNETAGAYVYSDLERMHEMMEVLPPKMVDSQIHFLAAFVKGETTVSSVVSGKRNASRLVIASADAGQDATTPIDTVFDGPYPTQWKSAKQGGIVLGIGGDNSPWGNGIFFEGVIARGFAPEAADNAILSNVRSAGYKKDIVPR